MANKKKNFWYVLVLTEQGPVFVTDIQYQPYERASWDTSAKPLGLSESKAKDLATTLMMNFETAYPIWSPGEITGQPYLYDKGKFEWVWNK